MGNYRSIGNVFLFGDFNSRTKDYPDFIENDAVQASVALLSYTNDEYLSKRVNPDLGHNEYGSRLLSLCKSTGVRIVNGRHKEGYSNDFTFNGARGLSTIDYLLTTSNMFRYIEKFIVGNFTTFSDHAPLHIGFKCFITESAHVENNVCNRFRKIFKWDPGHIESCKNTFFANTDVFETLNFENVSSQGELDEGIETLTNFLNVNVGEFFKVGSCKFQQPKQKKNKNVHSFFLSSVDKPWFDENLKSKYRDYLTALRIFNSCKNTDNHQNLVNKKRIYKKTERKLKRSYTALEGDRLNILKKNNPKQFFAKFKKKIKAPSKVTIGDFYEHFKCITSCTSHSDIFRNESSEGGCIFEELDKSISVEC